MSFQLTKRKTFYAFHDSGQSFAIPLREDNDPSVAVKWEPELHVPLKQQNAPFALEISLTQP